MGMLILTRKIGEALVINNNVTVKILSVKGGQIKVGIDAPKDVKVNREEVQNKNNPEADVNSTDDIIE